MSVFLIVCMLVKFSRWKTVVLTLLTLHWTIRFGKYLVVACEKIRSYFTMEQLCVVDQFSFTTSWKVTLSVLVRVHNCYIMSLSSDHFDIFQLPPSMEQKFGCSLSVTLRIAWKTFAVTVDLVFIVYCILLLLLIHIFYVLLLRINV